MASALTCHNCKRPGHKKRDRNQLNKKSDKSSGVVNDTMKWCSYHQSNGHSNEKGYEQQSESVNLNRKKI